MLDFREAQTGQSEQSESRFWTQNLQKSIFHVWAPKEERTARTAKTDFPTCDHYPRYYYWKGGKKGEEAGKRGGKKRERTGKERRKKGERRGKEGGKKGKEGERRGKEGNRRGRGGKEGMKRGKMAFFPLSYPLLFPCFPPSSPLFPACFAPSPLLPPVLCQFVVRMVFCNELTH